ncbi:MAG: hypothetical protein A3A08_00385 [Candidatus Nealsonbacteria bacterium RIFCSPLOWO2_01_FULL_41_9]|uniref:Glycosyl transferase family 28 C-terminal domain-containing protein n=1 Tax=Candidatus Nealsonbacteria bacterium RIFCSPLOWO2_01_FULL_41_9 TaxID=1801671 RepID=A0A1G2EAV4_9BACT|nr:MAG: hypothetical protein A3A08_00385 [Candidatus Nealsonbacteria bacterium RIFCSPLOWO2_01_FULL_41_9]
MEQKAWVISVNMGYGHQRTAFPLKNIAIGGKIINANDYQGIPGRDRRIWETSRRFYEFISRLQNTPLIGNFFFSLYDRFQKIFSFYPKRDLNRAPFGLKQIYSLFKGGWGRDLIENLKIKNQNLKINLPIITTFFTPAFMAEFFNYPGEIFCVVCDADISRSWAPLNPKQSKIKYFTPTKRAAERLELYGVKKENIFLTGYPLPELSPGSLKQRLLNLDPQKKYFNKYKILIEKTLGQLPESADHPFTIMFAVGGAGAQKEIGIKLVKSLAVKIWAGDVKLILVAGIRPGVKKYFDKNLEKLKLKNHQNIGIIFEKDIDDYFQKFNLALEKTDVLWTKPSELSFYSALGIPIIIAPSVGSQEEFNKRWLLKSGFGLQQGNPKYAEQWLFDLLDQGYLAEAAMQGFIEGEKMGTLNIEKNISK